MKKKIYIFLMLLCVSLSAYSETNEPNNNLGKSLYSFKQEYPSLVYVTSDNDKDIYTFPDNNDTISIYVIFKNNYIVSEEIYCRSKDNYALGMFYYWVKIFNEKYSSALGKSTDKYKQFVFSAFNVDIQYLLDEDNTYMSRLRFISVDNTARSDNNYSENKNQKKQNNKKQSKDQKIEWYEVDYTENESAVKGMQLVGHFSASSSPSFFGSRTYSDAYYSAIKKLQKKAAKQGAKRLLIIYRSSMDDTFLTVKVEAIGYK